MEGTSGDHLSEKKKEKKIKKKEAVLISMSYKFKTFMEPSSLKKQLYGYLKQQCI